MNFKPFYLLGYISICLIVVISCSSPTGSGDGRFANVPSGEIVPVEMRDQVLTGISSDSINAKASNTQKWWLHVTSNFDYTNCGEEDDEITFDDDYYFAFTPEGDVKLKVGENGFGSTAYSWEWADESKSAIILSEYPDVEFELRALNSEEVIYASHQQGEEGCSVTTWEVFTEPGSNTGDGDGMEDDNDGDNGSDGENGDDSQGSTSVEADFSMIVEGPIGLTGMYLGEVDIEFKNRSSNSAVEFEWCWSPYPDGSSCEVFSTDEDPDFTFELDNNPLYSDSSYVTVTLTAWTEDGMASTQTKTAAFRMLEGLGVVEFGDEIYQVDDITYRNGSELVCSPQGYPLPENRPPYTEIMFPEIQADGASEPLTLRLAGEGDVLTINQMYSTSAEYPEYESTLPNRRTFYIEWSSFSSTYEDPDNEFSEGNTSNIAMADPDGRSNVLDEIYVKFTGSENIEISLLHVPHISLKDEYWDPEEDCRF